jgi:hypothetical protein
VRKAIIAAWALKIIEEGMRVFHMVFGGLLAAIKNRMARLFAEPEFLCSECERAQSCSFPPSDTCMVRLAQMARDPDRYQ